MEQLPAYNEMGLAREAGKKAGEPPEEELLASFSSLVQDGCDSGDLIRESARFFTEHLATGGLSGAAWQRAILELSGALHRAAEKECFGELEALNAMLRKSEDHFSQMSESLEEAFWIADTGTPKRLLYIAPSCKNVLGVTREELCERPRRWLSLIYKDDRRRVCRCLRNMAEGRLGKHEFRIVRPDGAIRWLYNEGWPVNTGSGKSHGMSGRLRDITDTKQAHEEFVRISEHEQRHFSEVLKDGICQHLTGTALVCKVLYNKLAARKDPLAHDLAHLSRLLSSALSEARQLSESLNFMPSGKTELNAALLNLSLKTSSVFSISCIFRCGPGVTIPSETTATHLYGIAKEAVNNAVRRGDAQRIRIRLRQKRGRLVLTVIDNGRGFVEPPRREQAVGLRMMAYRASESGGRLSIERGRHGGTVVTCSIPAE